MKCFTDFKGFHKLNFINTSQLSEMCGMGTDVPHFTDEEIRLCDLKQL